VCSGVGRSGTVARRWPQSEREPVSSAAPCTCSRYRLQILRTNNGNSNREQGRLKTRSWRQPSVANKKSTDSVDRYVGARIRMRRLMLKFSQTQLGDALGVSFQQVQKYENGSNRVGASRLQHIASILQVPVSFFFEEAPINRGEPAQISDAPSPELVTAFVSTTDGLRLIRALTNIKNTTLRRCIVQLVERIAMPPHD
jgi:transcriptional regulator with XRE-family HTH domain